MFSQKGKFALCSLIREKSPKLNFCYRTCITLAYIICQIMKWLFLFSQKGKSLYHGNFMAPFYLFRKEMNTYVRCKLSLKSLKTYYAFVQYICSSLFLHVSDLHICDVFSTLKVIEISLNIQFLNGYQQSEFSSHFDWLILRKIISCQWVLVEWVQLTLIGWFSTQLLPLLDDECIFHTKCFRCFMYYLDLF